MFYSWNQQPISTFQNLTLTESEEKLALSRSFRPSLTRNIIETWRTLLLFTVCSTFCSSRNTWIHLIPSLYLCSVFPLASPFSYFRSFFPHSFYFSLFLIWWYFFFHSLHSNVLINREVRASHIHSLHFCLYFNLVAQATCLEERQTDFIQHDIENLITYHITN